MNVFHDSSLLSKIKNILKQTNGQKILQPTFHPKKNFMVSRSKQTLWLKLITFGSTWLQLENIV